ncbi:MAG: hypothetical protein LC114_13135 [Bryobacterales bacterium]|nr:hypothetical protein [Bryobacterales bacterium]
MALCIIACVGFGPARRVQGAPQDVTRILVVLVVTRALPYEMLDGCGERQARSRKGGCPERCTSAMELDNLLRVHP